MKCPVCGEHNCPCYRAGLDDGLYDDLAADDSDEIDEEEEEDELEFERRHRG